MIERDEPDPVMDDEEKFMLFNGMPMNVFVSSLKVESKDQKRSTKTRGTLVVDVTKWMCLGFFAHPSDHPPDLPVTTGIVVESFC